MAESTVSLEIIRDGRFADITIGDTAMAANTKGLPGTFILNNGTTYLRGHWYAITANSGAPNLVAIAPGVSNDQHLLAIGILDDSANTDGLDSIVGDGSTTFASLKKGVFWVKITATSGGVITQDHVGLTAYMELGDTCTINQQVGTTAATAPKAGEILAVNSDATMALIDFRTLGA